LKELIVPIEVQAEEEKTMDPKAQQKIDELEEQKDVSKGKDGYIDCPEEYSNPDHDSEGSAPFSPTNKLKEAEPTEELKIDANPI
jgi:hypothetical protein